MAARLPVPGDDVGQWGLILNAYLLVAHNEDGTLREPIVDASVSVKGRVKLAGDLSGTADLPRVTSTSLSSPMPLEQGGTSANTRTGALNALLPDQAASANMLLKSDGTDASWIATTDITPDATTLAKGKVRLAGDLNGTAAAPTVVSTSLSAPLPINQGGTSGNTPQAALNALLPTQTGNAGRIMQTDGTNTSWVAKPNNDDVLALMWMEVAA